VGVDNYEPGNNWVHDDKTGFKIRARDAVKEWTGLVTHRDRVEQRHPQEYVRTRRDKQSVSDPRPQPVATYIGPLKTALAAAADPGTATLEVENSSRFEPADRVEVLQKDGSVLRTIVLSVPDSTHIILNAPLTWFAEVGALITNYTALSSSDVTLG